MYQYLLQNIYEKNKLMSKNVWVEYQKKNLYFQYSWTLPIILGYQYKGNILNFFFSNSSKKKRLL